MFAPGLHGLSEVGVCPAAHGGKLDVSIWPVAEVGWHGCVFVGSCPWPHGGNFERSIGVFAPGLHGLSCVGVCPAVQGAKLDVSICPVDAVGRHG